MNPRIQGSTQFISINTCQWLLDCAFIIATACHPSQESEAHVVQILLSKHFDAELSKEIQIEPHSKYVANCYHWIFQMENAVVKF